MKPKRIQRSTNVTPMLYENRPCDIFVKQGYNRYN